MTTITEALDTFNGMSQGDITSLFIGAGIDIVSVCDYPRSVNCPFATYLSRLVGRQVNVSAGVAFAGTETVWLPKNVLFWIRAWDNQDVKKARLVDQHKRVQATPNAYLSLG